MRVPLARPDLTADDEHAVLEALRSGTLTHGPWNERLEQGLAALAGVDHAVSVNSCASALYATLRVAGITGEVAIPSFTWAATANAVVAAGATPVWIDIEPRSYGIDPRDLRAKLSPRAEAIICVHYAGQLCEVEEIAALASERALLLVEDAAEALGARAGERPAGSFGVGCFSFFPSKNITTGEGGMVTTRDAELARGLRTFTRHGVPRDGAGPDWHKEATVPGVNFRLSNVLAALGVAQLDRLADLNGRRRAAADRLTELLSPAAELVATPVEKPGYHHVYQMYVVELAEHVVRDDFLQALRRRDVEASVHFTPPVHLHAYYRQRRFPGADSLPVTERCAAHVVTLPLFPAMTDAELEHVGASVLAALDEVVPAARRPVPRPADNTLDPRLLPIFYGDVLTRVQHVIDWVHDAVRKTVWEPERIRRKYLRRSVAEILADGDAFVLGPCPERTAVAALVLTANEIPYTIVVHERQVAGYGPPTAHIAVEVEHEGEPYWFDFGWRETRFFRGRYVYKADIEETIQILRFKSSDFDAWNMTIEQAFEIVAPQRIEMDEKLAWYCSQLDTITDDLLHDRIVFDPRHSVYAEDWAATAPVAA